MQPCLQVELNFFLQVRSASGRLFVFSGVKASERERALLVCFPCKKQFSKQTNNGKKFRKETFDDFRPSRSAYRWSFYIKVIAAKTNILRNNSALVMGICITWLSNSLPTKTWLSTPKRIFSFTSMDTTSVDQVLPNRKSLGFDYLKSRQMRCYTSKIGFCRRQPRLVTYATEISLLRSLVASQQKRSVILYS